MIPKITGGGRSFKGAYAYYGHDKTGTTRERVAWTHTENVLTPDPDKAWKVMAYTAREAERLKEASGQRMTGRKLEKPVFAYSLSWHPEQDPDKDHMLATARKSIEALGLTEHEAIIIAHRDEPQKHVHVIVNRVHPLTGLAADLAHSKRKLSEFARQHEREHGKVYCPQREANHEKRQRGEPTMYRDPKIAGAWKGSDCGRSFSAALNEHGYQLAQGRKRIVVVDPYGKVHSALRHLEGLKARDLQERIKDLGTLPDATKLSREVQAENRRRYDESRRYDAWAARQRARLQDRHLEQTGRLSNEHHQRRQQEHDRMEASYGLAAQQAAIQARQRRVEHPAWWQRLLGVTRREERKLEALRAGYENAKWRYDERMRHLDQQRESALARLQEQQETEREQSQRQFAKQRPDTYLTLEQRRAIDRQQPLAERTPARSRNAGFER